MFKMKLMFILLDQISEVERSDVNPVFYLFPESVVFVFIWFLIFSLGYKNVYQLFIQKKKKKKKKKVVSHTLLF